MLSPAPPLAVPLAPAREDRLPREIGIVSATILTVGLIIGSGIFRVPATVAAEVHAVGAMALVWVSGGVLAMCGALALAELGAMFPRPGGVYAYLHEAYGPVVAFVTGWVTLLVQPSAVAAVSLVFAEYFGTFFHLSDTGERGVAAVLVVAISAANYRSVRLAAALPNGATLAKATAIVALVAGAFVLGDGRSGALASGVSEAARWSGFGVALVAALWAYNGWQDPATLVGEVRDPGRTFPRAIITGVSIVIALYLGANAAYAWVLSSAEMARSSLVAADVMERVIGAPGRSAVSALVMVSTFGAVSGIMLSTPRIYFAMAEDGLFFARIAAVHPRFRTPHVAVVLTGAGSLVFIAFRTFEQLAEQVIVGIWPLLTLAVLAVIVLRVKRPDLPRPYRTPGYPFLPALFVLASLGVIASTLVAHPVPTLVSLAVTLAGVPLYFAWRARV